jgi:hypothetical protein
MATLLASIGPALLAILFYLSRTAACPRFSDEVFALAQVLWALVAPTSASSPGPDGEISLRWGNSFHLACHRLRLSGLPFTRPTPLQRQQTKWVVMAAFMMPFSDLFIRSVILPLLFLP